MINIVFCILSKSNSFGSVHVNFFLFIYISYRVKSFQFIFHSISFYVVIFHYCFRLGFRLVSVISFKPATCNAPVLIISLLFIVYFSIYICIKSITSILLYTTADLEQVKFTKLNIGKIIRVYDLRILPF